MKSSSAKLYVGSYSLWRSGRSVCSEQLRHGRIINHASLHEPRHQSFSAGRPCNIDFSLIDCRRPPETATASWGLPGFIQGCKSFSLSLWALWLTVLCDVLCRRRLAIPTNSHHKPHTTCGATPWSRQVCRNTKPGTSTTRMPDAGWSIDPIDVNPRSRPA
jgi:hypothetical protein